MLVFFFKHKTAYEMRISDWSSDVCSSDLRQLVAAETAEQVERQQRGMPLVHVKGIDLEAEGAEQPDAADAEHDFLLQPIGKIAAVEMVGDAPVVGKVGRASCRESVGQYV